MLSFAYVGSFKAVYGTSYGAMVATKALLFGLLYFSRAQFPTRARGPASSILASLKRFGEAEIGIGITVILTAASLTSLPPAADLTNDRVTGSEIVAVCLLNYRGSPVPPFRSYLKTLTPRRKKLRSRLALHDPTFPAKPARARTLRRKAWSEYNHHWAGIVVLSMGLLALVAQAGKISWARNWPLAFFGLSAFLFLRSDPETWPLGPVGFGRLLRTPRYFCIVFSRCWL